MIEIGICDDEKEYRDMLYEMVVRSLFQFDEVEFRYYETGNQIIKEIEKMNSDAISFCWISICREGMD